MHIESLHSATIVNCDFPLSKHVYIHVYVHTLQGASYTFAQCMIFTTARWLSHPVTHYIIWDKPESAPNTYKGNKQDSEFTVPNVCMYLSISCTTEP